MEGETLEGKIKTKTKECLENICVKHFNLVFFENEKKKMKKFKKKEIV